MLKGTLDDFTLPDIFRLMSLSKKTGSLVVERSAGDGKVWFRDGEVYYAESSMSKEPLGQKLVRAKVLTETQLRAALDEQEGSGMRLGQVLMEAGLVDEDQIVTVVRQQIEDAVFDLLRWELGQFLWQPGDEMQPEVTIYVSVENLIMEASRRLDELGVIQRKIPSVETILAMAAAPPEGAVEINIMPEEWRILVLVNGTRTVREIGSLVGLDDFAAMRTLYGLMSAGLIEVVGGGEASDAADEVEVEQEQIEETPEPQSELVHEVADDAPVAEESPPTYERIAEAVSEEPALEQTAEEMATPELDPVAEAEQFYAVDDVDAVAEAEQFYAVDDVDDVAEAEQFYAIDDVEPESEAQADEPVLAEQPLLEEQSLLLDPEPTESAGGSEASLVPEISDAAEEPETPVDEFDAPGPGELLGEGPASGAEEDPMAEELLSPEAAPAAAEQGPTAPPAPAPDDDVADPAARDVPVPSEGVKEESLRVDRIAAVRELAGLFSEGEEEANGARSRARAAAQEPEPEQPDNRKRVEDDEQVTRGLISRLIDGVKGL